MCGLFGGAALEWNQHRINAVYELGLTNMTRGMDGTGMFSVVSKEGKNKRVYRSILHGKSEDEASVFLSSGVANQCFDFKKQDLHAVAGHCRWATVGDINSHNAHPFKVGNIIGMHNGTIQQFNKPDFKDIGSDSAVLYHKMAKEGLFSALKAARWGAYALCWTDRSDSKIRFIRNNDRPLWFAVAKKKDQVYWSSEKRHLCFALNEGVRHFDLWPLGEHILLTLNPFTCEIEKEEVADEIFPFADTPSKGSGASWPHVFGNAPWWDDRKNVKKINVVRSHRVTQDGVEVKGYEGYHGLFMTLKGAALELSEGCAACGHQASVQDPVVWTDYTTYICHKCKKEDGFQQYQNCGDEGKLVTRYFTYEEENDYVHIGV